MIQNLKLLNDYHLKLILRLSISVKTLLISNKRANGATKFNEDALSEAFGLLEELNLVLLTIVLPLITISVSPGPTVV